MSTTEQDFDSRIEEKPCADERAKNAPQAHPFLYEQRGRVKPDPETDPLALLDWKEWTTLG